MILLDCDVLLDAVLDRADHAGEANALLDYIERAGYPAFMAWHTVANLYYIARPHYGRDKTVDFIRQLTAIVSVADANSASVHFAAELAMADFEDALQVAAARNCGAWYIVTRNIKDYARSPILAIRPGQALVEIR